MNFYNKCSVVLDMQVHCACYTVVQRACVTHTCIFMYTCKDMHMHTKTNAANIVCETNALAMLI